MDRCWLDQFDKIARNCLMVNTLKSQLQVIGSVSVGTPSQGVQDRLKVFRNI